MNRGRLHPLAIRLPGPFSGPDRRCAHPGCITLLNGYNPGPHCLGHTVDEAITDARHSADLELEAKRDARVRERVGA